MGVPTKYIVQELMPALSTRAFPTVVVWNRLEGRPRKDDFSRALKAEVRDAWWMLCKQWQVGEFLADDAGSPIFAKVRLRSSPVTDYQAAGGETELLPADLPLEAKVEARGLSWRWNGQKMHLDLRGQLGRHWRKLLAADGLAAYAPKFLAQYPIALPPRDAQGDHVYAHRRGWQQYAALAGRVIDGGDLYEHLLGPGGRASDGIALDAAADGPKLDALGAELVAWFAQSYLASGASSAWKPEYLEHQFACAGTQAGREVVLGAEEYAHGHLDWYAFDRRPRASLGGVAAPEQLTVSSFLPAPVAFEGMPDARWWSLEDRKTDFGAVKPSTTELTQLLLVEFGLIYSNDWFLLPLRVPTGTLARVEGLAVTNNFGERFWIDAAGAGAEDNWHRWSMFQISAAHGQARIADTSLLLPPATARTLDGAPLEEIELVRDEVANMVWAIERTVPSVTGAGRAGKDEGREVASYQRSLITAPQPPSLEYKAAVSYLAMTSVPEHWIPFIPTHVPGSVREVQLQRGRMLRIIPGAPLPPPKIPPRTTLVREGLDVTPAQPYFLHEEEVPRAGALVTLGFRRTRWLGGQAPVWLGVRKRTGRGERSSGLAFDAIVDKPRE